MFLARKRLRALEDTLTTAVVRIDQLEAERKSNLLELDEMYEKLRRLYGRIVKRDQRATQAEPEVELEEPPCADPISDRVLKFREAKAHVLSES